MINQEILNWFFGLFGILAGAVLKVVWDEIKGLQNAQEKLTEKTANIEILVAGNYATRDHVDRIYRELASALFKKLDKIEDKLNDKVNRAEINR
ncbi:MAG: hypothetical protein M0R47_15950 [Methylobacter sp.]|uniref:hypothetical protein n=1 Tax=Methylobacter sp. TaxID=2051955 RepID=UPI0025F9BA8A|nr:hypothetical protein [Methylobacter sp.]MCK9622014.1 hypothetical protein [Methylobacter sp.]